MKKQGVLLLSILFSLFLSCEIGLGSAVDVADPTVGISYPPKNAIVRDTFIASGECNDDMEIASVQVSLINPETNKTYGPYAATVDKEKNTWSVTLNKKDDAIDTDIFSSYKQWEFPDGNYIINAVAVDQQKKKSPVATSPIAIDNTAPVLIVSKPLAIGNDTATVFGRSLKLAGDIAEDHETSRFVLNYREYDEVTGAFIDKTGTPTQLKTLEITDSAELNAISSSNPLIIAQYSDDSKPQHQKYLEIHGNNDNETKYFYAGFLLEDNAKLYINPEDSGSGNGNQTTQYYILGTEFQNILAVNYSLTAQKLKEILKGQSEDYSAEEISEITKSLSKTGNYACSDALEKETDESVAKAKSSKFSLNPHNNPTWALDEYGVSRGMLDAAQNGKKAEVIKKYTAGSSLILTLNAGRDASYPDPKTVKVWLYDIYADTDNDTTDYYAKSLDGITPKLLIGEEGEGDSKKTGIIASSWDESADDLTKTYTFVLNTDNNQLALQSNHFYRLIVTGKDRNEMSLEPEDEKAYILKLSTSNNAPKVTILDVRNPNEETGEKEGKVFGTEVNTLGVTISGIINTDGVPVRVLEISKIEVFDASNSKVLDKTNFDTTDIVVGEGSTNQYPFTINLKKANAAAGFTPSAENKYRYDVYIKATDNNESESTEKAAKFYVDNKKPDVSIKTITPSVSKTGDVDTVNGTITVSGSASDSGTTGSGLKALSYEIKKAGTTVKGPTPISPVAEAWSFTIPTKDLDDNSNYTIEVSATDVVGNVNTSAAKEIKVDQSTDTPKFKPTNADETVNTADNNTELKKHMFNTVSNYKLTGYITDDDGIGSVVVKCQKVGGSEIILTPTSALTVDAKRFDFSYSFVDSTGKKLDQGKYKITVEIKDSFAVKGASYKESNNDSETKEFYITIDDGAPVFSAVTPSDLNSTVYKLGNIAGSDKELVISGTITDPNGIAATEGLTSKHYIKKTSDSGTYYEEDTADTSKPVSHIVLSGSTDKTKTFTDTITLPKASGTYKVIYTAKDIYDQVSTYEVEYSVDVKNPVINKVELGVNEISGNDLTAGKTINGYITDNSVVVTALVKDPKDAGDGIVKVNSGIKDVKYYLNGADTPAGTMTHLVSEDSDAGEKWSANVTFDDGTEKTIKFIVTDSVGNYSETGSIKVNIDKTHPTIELKGYKISEGEEETSLIELSDVGKPSAYVHMKDIVLFGNYSDGETGSGIKELSFKIGTNSVTPNDVTYYNASFEGTGSTLEDSLNNVIKDANKLTYSETTAKQIKSFVAVINHSNFDSASFTNSDLIITGIGDRAGNKIAGETKTVMTLKKDANNPTVTGIQINKANGTAVYKADDGTYYIRNRSDLNKSDGKITISGSSSDSEELDKTELLISGVALDGTPVTYPSNGVALVDSRTSWSFNNLDLDQWKDEATVKIKAYDKAGNTYIYPDITIKFDVTEPAVLTKASDPDDTSNPKLAGYNLRGKEVYKYYDIKIGRGAYSDASYGKDYSAEITVTFINENTGSGIKNIEYKMLSATSADAYKDIQTGNYTGTLPSVWTKEDEFAVSESTYKHYGSTEEIPCYIGKATIDNFASTVEGVPNLIFVRATDNCGNESEWFVLLVQVDNTDPVVNEYPVVTNPETLLTNGKKDLSSLTGNVKEIGAGLKAIRVYLDSNVVVDGDLKEISEKTGFSKSDDGKTVTLTNSDSNKTLTITAKDKDGNSIDPTDNGAVEVSFSNNYGILTYTGYKEQVADGETAEKCSFANAASYATWSFKPTPQEGTWFNSIKNSAIPPKLYLEVEDWAEDASGNGNKANPLITSLEIDIKNPVASVLGPDNSKALNGKQTIRGSVQEDKTPAFVQVYYSTATTPPAALSGWTPLKEITTVPEVYNFSFEKNFNELITGDEGKVHILIYTKDQAGNENLDVSGVTVNQTSSNGSVAYKSYQVDKNSDRPVVTVKGKTLLPEGELLSVNNYLMLDTNTLNINVVDDDGIKEAKYRIVKENENPTAEEGWKTLSISQDSAAVKFVDDSNNVLEGKHKLEFRITDKDDTVFTSSGITPVDSTENQLHKIYLTDMATIPNLYGTNDTGKTDPTLYVNIDTKPPVVRIEGVQALKTEDQTPVEENWKNTGYSNMILGGPETKYLTVKISASDEGSGVDKVELSAKLKGVSVTDTPASAPANDDGEYRLTIPCTISGTESANENLEVSVKVYDKAGKNSSESITLKVDNKKPEITISAPDTSKIHSGSIIAEGSVNEEATLYYAISPLEASPANYTTSTEFKFAKYDKDMSETIVTLPAKNKAETQTINPSEPLKDLCSYKPLNEDSKLMSFYLRFDGEPGTATELHSDSLNQWIKNIGITNEEDLTAIGNAAFNDIVKLYLHIKAVDDAGNINEEKHEILLDPQGNRPKVTIGYPSEAVAGPNTDGLTLGGAPSIIGTASGMNGVDYVWLQIDTNGTEAEDYVAEWDYEDFNTLVKKDNSTNEYPYALYSMKNKTTRLTDEVAAGTDVSNYAIRIPVSGLNWNQTINKAQELFSTDTTKPLKPVTIWAYATDSLGFVSSAEVRKLIMDKDSPVISQDLWLVKWADGKNGLNGFSYDSTTNKIIIPDGATTAIRAYNENDNIKGKWYLLGYVSDGSGINEISYTVNNGTNKKPVTSSGMEFLNTDGSGSYIRKVAIEGKTTFNYLFCLPIGDDEEETVNKYTINFDAEEVSDSSTPASASRIFTVLYDNKKPVLGTESITASITNSNGVYGFGGYASELPVNGVKQTGVERIAFYFTRNIKEQKTRIFDPMIKSGSSGNYMDYSQLPLQPSANANEDNGSYGLYWDSAEIAENGVTGATVTLKNTPSVNIHVGGLAKVNGVIYRIDAVDSANKTISLSGTPGNASSIFFAIANVVDNPTREGEGSIRIEREDGYGNGYYSNGNFDDGDFMVESLIGKDNNYEWKANINSKNISDGPVTLHYVVFDKAGNVSDVQSVDCVVRNNAPRLAGVTVGTDVNGDGDVTGDERITDYARPDNKTVAEADKSTSLTVPSGVTDANPISLLKIMGRTVIKPEIVGGNGDLYYSYQVSKRNAGSGWDTQTPVTSANKKSLGISGTGADDTTSKVATIDWSVLDILKAEIEDGENQKFSFTFWDSTPGLDEEDGTAGVDSQTSTLNLIMDVAIKDKESPYNKIIPFYWKDKAHNSLAGNSTAKGHIELTKDLLDSFTAEGNGIYDRDPKVSGAFKLEGIARDNSLLKNLYVTINNGTEKTYKIATYGEVSETADDGTISKVVKWTEKEGTGWKASITQATYGEYMAAGYIDVLPEGKSEEDLVSYASQEYGHVVHWTMEIDTEAMEIYPKADVVITVSAEDKGTPEPNAAETDVIYSQNAWENNGDTTPGQTGETKYTCKYKIDVVPYIRGIKTYLSTKSKKADSSEYDRTALGHYPIKSTEGIYLYGFNLKGNNAGILCDSTKNAAGEPAPNTATLGTKTTNQNFESYKGFDLYPIAANALTEFTSGPVYVTVDDVKSLNNENNNNAKGAYTDNTFTAALAADDFIAAVNTLDAKGGDEETYKNFYNRKPNAVNNNILTDDIELDVWYFNSNAATPDPSGRIDEPTMRINPSSKIIGFAFLNSSVNNSAPVGQSSSYNTLNRSGYTGQQDFHSTCTLAYDSRGWSYSLDAGGNEQDPVQLRIIDASGTEKKRIKIEHTSQKGLRDTGADNSTNTDIRYKVRSPSIVTSPNGTNANIYMAYYDSFNDEIRYRTGATNNYGLFVNDDDNNGYYSYSCKNAQVIATDKDSNLPSTISYNGTPLGGAGEFVCIDVIPANTKANSAAKDIVVIVWYEAATGNLLYAYNTNPGDYSWKNDNTISNQDYRGLNSLNWNGKKTIFTDAGEYCKIAVDGKGGIHIAAYDSKAGDLRYAYLPTYSSTYTEATMSYTVDSYRNTGSHLTMDVALDENGNAVPYISYMGSEYPKFAYLKTLGAGTVSDMFTGKWEVSYLPTDSNIPDLDAKRLNNLDNRINVGVWKKSETKNNVTTNGILDKSKKGTNSAGTNKGTCWGNDTANPVLSYSIAIDTANDRIETAQKQ